MKVNNLNVLRSRLVSMYLVFLPLYGLGDGHEVAVDVSVETGLDPVGAGEGEFRNEGDGCQHLAVRRSVGGGRHLRLRAGAHGGPHQHQDTQHGQHPRVTRVICKYSEMCEV